LAAISVVNALEPIVLPRWRGAQPLNDRITRARTALVASAGESARLLEQSALRARLEALPAYNCFHGYAQLKPALAAMEAELVACHGAHIANRIGLGLLLELVASHEQRWLSGSLDPELKPDFVDSMHRVLDTIERGGSNSTRMTHDNYCKELSICLHRLIPAGGQLIDPGSGLPRSLLVRSPLFSIPKKLGYAAVLCGGFRPFAEFHTHERMRHLFTPDGWEYCFRRLPAVFRSYPRLKGVLGVGWFFDPQLETISPNLSFLREVSKRWGAIIMRGGVDSAATEGALLMSQHRRDLHNQGMYQPMNYHIVAAKSRILAHARDIGLT
jgi:hypothetical protein